MRSQNDLLKEWFARYYTGDIRSTVGLMAEDGIHITESRVSLWFKDEKFISLLNSRYKNSPADDLTGLNRKVDLLAFWSRVMEDGSVDMRHRLKASESLANYYCMFKQLVETHNTYEVKPSVDIKEVEARIMALTMIGSTKDMQFIDVEVDPEVSEEFDDLEDIL